MAESGDHVLPDGSGESDEEFETFLAEIEGLVTEVTGLQPGTEETTAEMEQSKVQIHWLASYASQLEDELVRYHSALVAAYADSESLRAKVQSLEAELASAMAAKIDLQTRSGGLEDDLAGEKEKEAEIVDLKKKVAASKEEGKKSGDEKMDLEKVRLGLEGRIEGLPTEEKWLQRGGGLGGGAGVPNRNPSNGRPVGGGSSGTELALKHYVQSTDWSPDEQQILEDGLVEFAHESSFSRCVKIALQLEGKTTIDVAWRCRLMRERVTDLSTKPSAHLAARPNIPACNPPILSVDNVDDISHKEIGGPTRQLLERNVQIFHQRDANLGNLVTQENLNLLFKTRDIVLAILNETNDVPGVMEQMPQHPVRMNHELANSILPGPSNIQS